MPMKTAFLVILFSAAFMVGGCTNDPPGETPSKPQEPTPIAPGPRQPKTTPARASREPADAGRIDELIEILKAGTTYECEWGVGDLPKKGDGKSSDILIRVVKHPELVVEAAKELGDLGDPRAVPALIKVLSSEYLHLLFGGEPVIMDIGDRRKDKLRGYLEPRKKAAEALAKIGDAQAIKPLIEVLKDSDAGMRKSALDALKTITKQNFPDDHSAWKGWFDSKARGK
jgi:hypothetical protein